MNKRMFDKPKLTKSQQGKKNKRDGAKFELSVRKDLEEEGWIVTKWMNNVEFRETNKSIFVCSKKTTKETDDWDITGWVYPIYFHGTEEEVKDYIKSYSTICNGWFAHIKLVYKKAKTFRETLAEIAQRGKKWKELNRELNRKI